MKKLPIHAGWGEEHTARPWSRVAIEDPKRCPMCGYRYEDVDDEDDKKHSGAEIIYRLAMLNQDAPVVLQILFRRILNLAGSRHVPLEEIAQQVIDARNKQATMTRQGAYEQCKVAAAMFPELKALLNPDALHER